MTYLAKAWLAACVLLALCIPRATFAQSQATTAEINGRVTDVQGGVLPGVTVTAKNAETGLVRSTTSNDEGVYVLPLLPPGQYEVSIELAGFGPVKKTITLTVGANVTMNQTLQVGTVQESITVTGRAPAVETSATVRTTTVDSRAIANLPINGRRFQDFVTLTPTVQVDTSRGQLSFAGQRGVNANVSIDGADHNQAFFGGIRGGERSNTAFTVPQESIQEFQVVAAGYAAEFGRSTGGLVNAITKSGTNTEHGSLFYVNRPKKLAERNAFGQSASPDQQQFGGSIGGPITKDKLFYFGAGEFQKLKNTRNVVFNLTGVTRTAANAEAYDYFKSLETPFDATNDAQALLGRIDYQASTANRLSLKYSFSNNRAENSNATGNSLSDTTTSALSNNGTERDRTNIVVGQFTSVLRSSLLFEARGSFAKERRPRDANAKEPLIQGAVGNVGTVGFLGENVQFDTMTQAIANLTAIAGTHSLKFGGEFRHVDAGQTFGFNQFGQYFIAGSGASGATTMLELLSVGGTTPNRFDAPTTTTNYNKQLGNLTTELQLSNLAFYAQDTWKVAPKLTLNYGLRWEGAMNPTPEANNDYMLNALRGYTFPNGRTVDPTQIPDHLKQFAPRVGVAWTPTDDGRTVVRGYSGIYYAQSPLLLFADPMNNFRLPPGNLSTRLPFTAPAGNPNNTIYKQFLLLGIDLNRFPLNNLPILTTEQITQLAGLLGIAANPFVGAQVMGVDQDFKNPRATQAGAGIEREILPDLTVGADYTYVKTDHLQRNREMNIGVPTISPTDPARRPTFSTTRPLSALGSVQVRESSAKSEYNALALTTRLRKAWGQASINYVLSKSMSDDDNERDSGGVQYENTFDLGPEWGPARLDRRHQFNGYVLFDLPYHFDASTSFRLLSGLPIDATFGRDVNSSQGGSDRPYSAPGVPFTRNSFRNEPFKEVNFRFQWAPTFAGSKRVAVTAEFFNVFNWDNIQLSGGTVTNYCAGTAPADCGFGPPTNPNFLSLTDQTPGSATLGRLIQTNNPGAPRQVQLGVRFEF